MLGLPASGCSPLAPGPPPWGCGLGNETVPRASPRPRSPEALADNKHGCAIIIPHQDSEQPWSFRQYKGTAAAEMAPGNTDDAAAFQWEGSSPPLSLRHLLLLLQTQDQTCPEHPVFIPKPRLPLPRPGRPPLGGRGAGP